MENNKSTGTSKLVLPILICELTIMATQILGLDICADIMVGDAMRSGISGGQKKRLTTGSKETFTALLLLLVYIHP